MTTTKIRTIIATLAAAFTVALAIAPVTPEAHARPNDGRFSNSTEAHRKGCENLYGQYVHNISMAVQIDGDPDGSNYGDETAAASDARATEVRETAKSVGCGWAA